MIHTAIVEDEDFFARELEQYIDRFGQESGERFSVRRFADGDEIAENYAGGFDLILMDIQMKYMDGMTAAEKIRETDSQVIIIFITNKADYAIRGYQVDALDYVLKPINYLSFAQKMHRALERLQNRRGQSVVINTRNGMLRMDVRKIYYIESQGHNLTYYTAVGDYTVREKIQDVEEALAPYGFFRSNKGYLVNLHCVDGVADGCCLVNGRQLQIARARRTEFMAALARYMGDS